MKQEVQVPEVGESVSSGILATWLKNSGDQVSEGEDLFELETDKATLSVPSPVSGVLETQAAEGDEVEIGQTVAVVDTEKSAEKGTQNVESDQAEKKEPKEKRTEEKKKAEKPSSDRGEELSPAVRRIVEENALDPGRIEGTGKDGRITKEDALKAAGELPQQRKAAKEKPAETPASRTAGQEKRGTDRKERQTRKTLSTLRKRIAANLVESKQSSAHLTTFNEVDMSQVSRIRKAYRDTFEERYGVRLGFMSFFVKASCRALQEFPEVNAFLEENEIVYNNYYDIGVALSTDRGLIVPVLKDADKKSFAEIETEIISFMERAREKKLSPDELTGGTFTISNGGVFGSMLSTPIPNPPQTAILGMHSIQKRPVVVDDEIVIRPMMYLALTYDHRLIDGREAVRFLVKLKNLIEDPNQILLEL